MDQKGRTKTMGLLTKLRAPRRSQSMFLKATTLPKRTLPPPEAGFTLIEIIVVTVLISVLAAIAVPGWLGFVQRQRVNTVRDEIFILLQRAQDEAKRRKLSRRVEFDPTSDPPRYAVYEPGSTAATAPPSAFQNLGAERGLGSGEVLLSVTGRDDSVPLRSITFDYQGAVEYVDDASVDFDDLENFKVVVTTPNGDDKRCVKVRTLLGALVQQSNDDCDN